MNARTFDFRGTKMQVLVATTEAAGAYTVIAMEHPPLVGPALHLHPTFSESFYVLQGAYTFFRGDERIEARVGDCVVIPPGTPHRYQVGPAGGRALVISPPHLEDYFQGISNRLATGSVSLDEEKAFAACHGQNFLDMSAHWRPTTGLTR